MATRTERKVVNDNGQLKLIDLDINNSDTLATITSGSHRTVVPLRGNNPVASEEVRIDNYAPTYPGSNWYDYKASNQYVKDSEIPELQNRVRKMINLPNVNYTEKRENGGKMVTDYMQEGGVTADPMEEIQALVEAAMGGDRLAQSAIKEILTKAQQGDPQALQYAEVIKQMMQGAQTMKKGGKTKKAQKGFAAPCKCKLARVGGKIMEVDSCTGRPYKKKGGLIQYGDDGIPGGIKIPSQLARYEANRLGLKLDTAGRNHWMGIGNDGSIIYSKTSPFGNWFEMSSNEQITPEIAKYVLYNYGYKKLKDRDEYLFENKDTGLWDSYNFKDNKITSSGKSYRKVDGGYLPADVVTTPNQKVDQPNDKTGNTGGSTGKGPGYFASKGLGEYQSAQARLKFIDDNKDWLASKGFDVNTYKSKYKSDYNQNVNLAKLLSEFKANPPQAAKPEEPKVELPKVEQPLTVTPYTPDPNSPQIPSQSWRWQAYAKPAPIQHFTVPRLQDAYTPLGATRYTQYIKD